VGQLLIFLASLIAFHSSHMTQQPSLCPISAGIYRIGDEKFPNSRPVHKVGLLAYNISASVVTNAEFAAFIDAGGYSNTLCWTQMGWRWQGYKQETQPAYWDDARFNQPSQPVVGVSWYEAAAYARWLALETKENWRLLTEAEWEVAASNRQAEGSDVPELDTSLINTVELGVGVTWDAQGKGNQAWCGAWNMLGNVWEWTSSRWGRNWQILEYAYPYDVHDGREDLSGSYARIMRGGSYFDVLKEAHPSNRGRFLPGSRASNIGFRLALG
jgi:formylglycine-generating enzyme required for sulfatase activity